MLCGREILQDEPLWNVKKAYIEVPRGYLNWLDHTLCLYTGAYCLILNISECGPTPPPNKDPKYKTLYVENYSVLRYFYWFKACLAVSSVKSYGSLWIWNSQIQLGFFYISCHLKQTTSSLKASVSSSIK